jgi:menaquinone-dependent protoporphyrinogen oxidase
MRKTAMPVLVAYASRHGATQGIAERIADRLRAAGLAAEARRVSDVRDVSGYDAFVIGSAAYMFHWLKEAREFVNRHRAVLAARPVWLFSSGPVGTDTMDKEGRDVLVVNEPKEFDELRGMLHPQGVRVFFGAWDPTARPAGLMERLVLRMPAVREALPTGDFRDWPAIEAWADSIAAELGAAPGVSA